MRTKEEILARLKDAKEKQVKESDNQCLDSWISALSWVLAKEGGNPPVVETLEEETL